MPLLELCDVSKQYGQKLALDNVSFVVEPGEVFGLLGPNGAGKTTTIRIVMDIVRPTTGSVWLFERPLRRAFLDRLAYLPEERGLYGKQRVIDILVYFAKLKGIAGGEARKRAAHWLERVGLGDVADHNIERLSKGMSQKVQIAATLLSEPELCFLDEPFSGLDPVNTVLIRDLISEVKKSGRTTILSTHQMSMVETLCDRVGLLSRGKLVVYGDVNQVREQYSMPEVRVTLGGALPELRGVRTVVAERERTWRLLLEDDVDPGRVLGELVQSGIRIDRFERVLASMEDIFIRVTGGTGK